MKIQGKTLGDNTGSIPSPDHFSLIEVTPMDLFEQLTQPEVDALAKIIGLPDDECPHCGFKKPSTILMTEGDIEKEIFCIEGERTIPQICKVLAGRVRKSFEPMEASEMKKIVEDAIGNRIGRFKEDVVDNIVQKLCGSVPKGVSAKEGTITFDKSALRDLCRMFDVPYDEHIIAFTKEGVITNIFDLLEYMEKKEKK